MCLNWGGGVCCVFKLGGGGEFVVKKQYNEVLNCDEFKNRPKSIKILF